MASGEFRLRLRYRKAGRLRWLSHLEVLHALERGIRRSGLEYAVTHGFSPHLKAAFGPALPVGTASEREYLDVFLTRYTAAEDALSRLVASLPEDLAPVEAAYVADSAPSLTAAINVAAYEVSVRGEGVAAQQVQAAVDALAAAGELRVEHKGKQKVYDLARALPEEPRATVSQDGDVHIAIAVRIGPEGAMRPDVFIREALAQAGLDAAVTNTTRTDVFIETEGGRSRPL